MKDFNQQILGYLDNDSSIIKLLIDSKGFITHANKFAVSLAGRNLEDTALNDFFTDFNANLNVSQIVDEGVQKMMLNVNTFHGLPQTYYFTSFKSDKGVVLFGEMDTLEVEGLRNTMVSLNNELNNMTRELQKKNVQLDQLNQLKNQFLGMAAHDLRNPISSIMMFSEFVLETQGDEITDELKQILDLIRNSSEFMLKLLDELLDVVKIESGKLSLNFELVNMEDVLRKNIKINSILASKKEINIALNIPSALPPILIDQIKIEQVLNNLISNAIKYSFQNSTITVSAFSTDKEMMISVHDQGQGIPKKEIDKIFTPFAKISVQGTAGEKSTGLGLSIVKRIITGHLGRIWVESEAGKGSTFYFTLPLKRS